MVPDMTTYDPDNIFGKIIRGEIPNHTIYEDDEVLVFMDVLPMSDGHCLVVPKAPSRNLLDADAATLSKLMPVVQKIARAAKSAMNADGMLIQQFNEKTAGQTVFHLHIHIVPVFEGKTLARHADKMADNDLLADQAKRIAAAI